MPAARRRTGFTAVAITDTLTGVIVRGSHKMSDRVLVLHTGGTIGMIETPHGNAPSSAALAPYLEEIVASSRGELPNIDFLELDPLIDSSNATPETWCTIAETIFEHHDDYSGFVVLHGTDTMAYTSSALSFLLPSFGKPVVVTGSQIPISRARSDGRQNLISALQVAARPDVPEVSLLFGEVLLRGNRATKVDASSLDAFDSPRLAPLAQIGVDIFVNRSIVRASADAPRFVKGGLADVAAVRLFPGISSSVISSLCGSPVKGLVLEAYGAGNGPSEDAEFLAAIEAATSGGIVVVVVTQCLRGSVMPGAYATGSALMRAGAVPGFDMTSEAALTKLAVLLGQSTDTSVTVQLMQQDVAGELTRS